MSVIQFPLQIETSKPSASRHSRYINELFQIACAIEEPTGNSRMAACIVMHNKIVSYGLSQYKTHPLQSRFSKHHDAIYLHAEVCAIKNALRLIDLPDLLKCTLYIARAKYSDENKTSLIPGLAKPCCGCSRAIATFGIKKVIYSLDISGWANV